MEKRKLIILLLIILVFICSVVFSLITMMHSNIISGVSINDIDLSNTSKSHANELISNLISKKTKSEITLIYTNEKQEKYEKVLDLSNLNIEYDQGNTINEAYNLGRGGNIFSNNLTILKTLISKKNIKMKYSYDNDMLDTITSDISANLPRESYSK